MRDSRVAVAFVFLLTFPAYGSSTEQRSAPLLAGDGQEVTSPSSIDEVELRSLNSSEIDFLRKNCPESTEVVSSGIAIVHGLILRPPVLLSVNRDRVHVNGIQVSPRETRPKYHSAKKIVDRLQVQYQDEKRRGSANPLAPVLEKAKEFARAGLIEKFEVLEGDHRQLSVTAEGREWHWTLDTCSALTTSKRHYIIEQLLWSYTGRKGAGIEIALRWLRARLDDLKQLGIISKYNLNEEEETVFVRFDCALTDNAFAFYDPRTKRASEHEKAWKTKRGATESRRSSIAQALNSGKLLLHSYDFEKYVPQDSETLGQLDGIRRGTAAADAAETLKVRLGLSRKQAETLLNELR